MVSTIDGRYLTFLEPAAVRPLISSLLLLDLPTALYRGKGGGFTQPLDKFRRYLFSRKLPKTRRNSGGSYTMGVRLASAVASGMRGDTECYVLQELSLVTPLFRFVRATISATQLERLPLLDACMSDETCT